MSISLEAENGVLVGAYPNPEGIIPHIGLVLCDPDAPTQKIIVAKLSPNDARAIAQALADADERVALKWEEWITETEGGGDG